MLGTLEPFNPLSNLLILLELNGINPILIPHTAIPLSHTNKLGPGLRKELRRKVSHITEPLHRETLSLDARLHPQSTTDILILEHGLGDVVDSQASGFSAAADARLVEGFAGHAPSRVDVGVSVVVLVGVLHPAHLALAGSDVGAWHVHGRSDAVLLGELDGVLPGQLLDFVEGVFLGVDLDAALS
jgi:hypothetical protein